MSDATPELAAAAAPDPAETEGVAAARGATGPEADVPADPDAEAPAPDLASIAGEAFDPAAPDVGAGAGAASPAADATAADAAYPLPARLRVAETEALLAWLRARPEGAPVAFDAAAVESLSTPSVLVLAAAARACAAAGRPAAVERPAPAFVDAFSDLGLFQDLMKMEFRP